MDIPVVVNGGRMFFCPSEMPIEEEAAKPKKVEWSVSRKKNLGGIRPLMVRPFVKKDLTEIQGIEHEGEYEGKPIEGVAYEANDVYSVTNVHPEILLSYVVTGKIYGFWEGNKLYINMETLKVFHQRSRAHV